MKRHPPQAARIVSCPQCGAGVAWSVYSAHRPFCSERCRLIDLGCWADEAYRIPVADSKDRPETSESGDGA